MEFWCLDNDGPLQFEVPVLHREGSPAPNCEQGMMDCKAEERVFSLCGLLSKCSVSDVVFRFSSRALRSELSLQFSSVPVRKPKEIGKRHLRVGARGGWGRKPESSELM